MKQIHLASALCTAGLLLSACGGGGGGGGDPLPTPDPLPAFVTCSGDVCTLGGVVNEDYALSASKQWRLDGVVQVGEGNVELADQAAADAAKAAGVTLTIPAGLSIKAFDDATLLVTRGSKLVANGTATSPITFSSLDDDFDGIGEWGGVVIQGFAPQYGKGNTGACFGTGTVCNVAGEGGDFIGFFGGSDEADDSGTLRYVRIAEGGKIAGPNNEVNGLTLQGVGSATDIEYIQVQGNLDDGIEWFGGTVNVKYAVLTNNDDDDIDFDEGYKGNIQYVIVKKSDNAAPQGSNDPRGIEANSSDAELVPQTEAVIANVSIIGGDVNNATDNEQPGARLRGAVTVSIYNSAVKDFDTGCIRVDDADTNNDGTPDVNSNVTLVNVLGDCADGFYDKRAADVEDNATATTVTFDEAYAVSEASAELGAAADIPAVDNGSGFAFDMTDYVGAVEPGTSAANAWWAGWTLPGTLSEATEAVEAADFVECDAGNTVCTVTGLVDKDYTLVAGVEWRIDGVVRVGDSNVELADEAAVDAAKAAGVTLRIRPGVNIKAFDDGTLLVTRGSKIEAEGTASAPITFSSLDDGFDGLGEWGGVVIQGFAPQYGKGNTGACFGTGTVCNVAGEGGDFIGFFGGSDEADDSGTLRYVRIAEGGKIAGPNNEVNGLTLQGVGNATDIEYIQVHNNLDDGIEWFGGTVNIKYAVLTGNDDDSIDFDEGYKGNIQYAIVKMSGNAAPQGSNDPRGIEANSSDAEFVPQTEAAIANVTIIAGPPNNAPNPGEPGARLRGAVTVSIFNSAVKDFDTKGCIRIDDADTDGNDADDVFSNVTLVNVLGECTAGFYDERAADTEINAGASTVTLDAAYALTEAAASLGAATAIPEVDNGSGFAFDDTDFIGAVEPGTPAGDAWWAGWIIDGSL